MNNTGLVLLAHGSRDKRWCAPFETLRVTVESSLTDRTVRLAYMEFVSPTLLEAAREAAVSGVNRLLVLPLFMAGGGHVDYDLPALVKGVERKLPELSVRLLPPVGEDAKVISAICAIAKEAVS